MLYRKLHLDAIWWRIEHAHVQLQVLTGCLIQRQEYIFLS